MADELPPAGPAQAAAATKYSYLGYEILQPGQTPTPGKEYATGEFSSQIQRYKYCLKYR